MATKILLLIFLSVNFLASNSTPDVNEVVRNGVVENDDSAWPYLVALVDFIQKEVFCTAILIARDLVMTAAHCFRADDFENSRLFYKCGKNYGCSSVSAGSVIPLVQDVTEEVEIDDIFIHQSYIENKTVFYHNDIALLKLSRQLDLSEYINTTRISEDEALNPASNLSGTIVGWGAVKHGGSSSGILRFAHVNVIGQDECQRLMNELTNWKICSSMQMSQKLSGSRRTWWLEVDQCARDLNESLANCFAYTKQVRLKGNICAIGASNSGSSICEGDSGGPLVNAATGEVIGIASGSDDCKPEIPSIFTNVHHFRGWITATTESFKLMRRTRIDHDTWRFEPLDADGIHLSFPTFMEKLRLDAGFGLTVIHSLSLVHFKKFKLEIIVNATDFKIEVQNVRNFHQVSLRQLKSHYQDNCITGQKVKIVEKITIPCIVEDTFVQWPYFKLSTFMRDPDMMEKVLDLFRAVANQVNALHQSGKTVLKISSNRDGVPGIHMAIEYKYSSFVLVAGGYYNGFSSKVELLDLESETSVSLSDLPFKTTLATGGLLKNTPIICGGRTAAFDKLVGYHNQCYMFEKTTKRWSLLATMPNKRAEASAIVAFDDTLWITCGTRGPGEANKFNSSYLIASNGQVKDGPYLDEKLSGHCSIKWHGEIFIIGGFNTTSYTRTVRIYQEEGFIFLRNGPSTKFGRYFHGCSVVKSPNHKGREVIIVAGGDPKGSETKVEIWDFTTQGSSWESIKDLPESMRGRPSLQPDPQGEGIFIIYEESIYKLAMTNGNYNYKRMNFRLQVGRKYFVSMAMPDYLANNWK